MIKEDRIELNRRFTEAFRMLEERGVIVKNDRSGKGVGDVAEKVLGNKSYGHIIRAFINSNNKRVIDYNSAKAFCRAYGINENWMLHGIGNPWEHKEAPYFASQPEHNGGVGNILFTTIRAFAGATIGADSREDNSFFSIPGVSGSGLVAFQIEGNSMEPVINNRDIVVCQPVEYLSDIRDNEIYAVRNNGSVWVKYVQKNMDKKGRVTSLKLISANYFDHDPFEEETNETTRVFKVIRRISSL